MAKRSLPMTPAALALLIAAAPAFAIEYRSVGAATVLYDAPSVKGKPLFVVRRLTPVEAVVNLEGWSKVRDADGGLAWIERRHLSEQRTVQVVADRAQVRGTADDGAPLVFEAEKGVALDLLEAGLGGWVRVRHRDGQSGFVRGNQVWGL